VPRERIKKVKVTKEEKISMVYEKKVGIGWDEYSFACSDQPKPEFSTALKSLAEHVIEMCELPESYLPKIIVHGVSFSYAGENNVMGATISAQMKLDKSNQNLNLNTPHKASEPYSEHADEKQLLSYGCVRALLALQKECQAYIKGERAQTTMFENVA
jgi:hypothetical protein